MISEALPYVASRSDGGRRHVSGEQLRRLLSDGGDRIVKARDLEVAIDLQRGQIGQAYGPGDVLATQACVGEDALDFSWA